MILIADSHILYIIQTLAPKIKRIKPITFQKRKPIVCIPKITRVQQGTSFSAVSSCCRGRFVAKYPPRCRNVVYNTI